MATKLRVVDTNAITIMAPHSYRSRKKRCRKTSRTLSKTNLPKNASIPQKSVGGKSQAKLDRGVTKRIDLTNSQSDQYIA